MYHELAKDFDLLYVCYFCGSNFLVVVRLAAKFFHVLQNNT